MMDINTLRPWWQLNGFARIRGTDRFWRKVQKTRDASACWPWLNGRTGSGYGAIRWHGRVMYAHVLAWQFFHGCEVPPGKVVRHHCDNPICCRPSHLILGTHDDNMADMVQRGRSRKGVLEPADVLEVRRLHAQRTPTREICGRFGITQKAVWFVVRRISYRHLEAA